MQQVARSLTPFTMPPMQVQRMDDFLALVPMPSHAANAAINAAAAACVTQLQPLAAPPSVDELAQRRAAEEFRFHMPLTGPLSLVDDNTQALVLDAAQQFFSDLPHSSSTSWPCSPNPRLAQTSCCSTTWSWVREHALGPGLGPLTARDDAALNAAGQSAMVGRLAASTSGTLLPRPAHQYQLQHHV